MSSGINRYCANVVYDRAGIGAESGTVSPGHVCGELERAAETRELVGFR